MKKPTILVGLGSGREAWLSIELDSLRFVLEIENGKRTVETLSLAELKTRLPGIASFSGRRFGGGREIQREMKRERPSAGNSDGLSCFPSGLTSRIKVHEF